MKILIQIVAITFGYILLRALWDAPQWGAVAGSWAFWACIRPKEW